MDDLISRQAAIDAIGKKQGGVFEQDTEIDTAILYVYSECKAIIKDLPSVKPEPLSDAYMKAVWTWLLNYQIKAAELKGRYTPYEVLSWVANDWRKEYEGFD